MSLLSDLLFKAKGVLGQPAPTGTETVAVRHDRYDAEDWQEVKDKSPAVQTVLEDLGQTFDYTEDLMEGMFDYMLKAEPEVIPASEMATSRKPNQKITLQSKETPESQQLRQFTKGDAYSSAMAVVAVSEKIRDYLVTNKELAEAAKDAADKQAEREQAEQDAAQAAADAAQAQGDQPADAEGPMTPDQAAAADALQAALDALANAQGAEQAAGEQLDAEMNAAAPGTRSAVRTGVREAAEEAENEAAALAAAGVDPGEARYMPFEERQALAQALATGNLKDFAKLIGRFRMEAAAERAHRIEHGRDVFADVELGRDLGRALGSEIAKLAGGPRMMKLDTLRRYSEGKLLLKKFEGTEKAGKGTICAVVDTSGSMTMNIGGVTPENITMDPTREAWAKAITFVLLDSARRQKRDFYAILFASEDQQRHYHFPYGGEPKVYKADGVTEIKVAEPIKNNRDLAVTLDLIGFMWNGGTNFEKPLAQAIKVIEERFDTNGKAKADIAFITDDDGRVSEAFMRDYLRAKEKVGIRTFGFAVGCSAGNTLTSVCDNVRSLADLSDTSEVTDVFRSI